MPDASALLDGVHVIHQLTQAGRTLIGFLLNCQSDILRPLIAPALDGLRSCVGLLRRFSDRYICGQRSCDMMEEFCRRKFMCGYGLTKPNCACSHADSTRQPDSFPGVYSKFCASTVDSTCSQEEYSRIPFHGKRGVTSARYIGIC